MVKISKFWKFKIGFFAENRQTLADIKSEGPFRSKVIPKIFLGQKNKNWKFYPKKFTPPPDIDQNRGGVKDI